MSDSLRSSLISAIFLLCCTNTQGYNIWHDKYSLDPTISILVFKNATDYPDMLKALGLANDGIKWMLDTAKSGATLVGGKVAKAAKPTTSLAQNIYDAFSNQIADAIISKYALRYHKKIPRGNEGNNSKYGWGLFSNNPYEEPGVWVVFMDSATYQPLAQLYMVPGAFMAFRSEKDKEGHLISRIQFAQMLPPLLAEPLVHSIDETKRIEQEEKDIKMPSVTVPSWGGSVINQLFSGQTIGAMGLKGLELMFTPRVHTIVNNTKRAFIVALGIKKDSVCKDKEIRTAVRAKSRFDEVFPTTVEPVTFCNDINKVTLYDIRHPDSSGIVIPPGTVEFNVIKDPLLITIEEYIDSPGKYYVQVANKKDKTIIRDSRLPQNGSQLVSPDSPEAITYQGG